MYLVTAFGGYNIPMFFIASMVALAAGLFWLIDPTKPGFDEPEAVAPLVAEDTVKSAV